MKFCGLPIEVRRFPLPAQQLRLPPSWECPVTPNKHNCSSQGMRIRRKTRQQGQASLGAMDLSGTTTLTGYFGQRERATDVVEKLKRLTKYIRLRSNFIESLLDYRVSHLQLRLGNHFLVFSRSCNYFCRVWKRVLHGILGFFNAVSDSSGLK